MDNNDQFQTKFCKGHHSKNHSPSNNGKRDEISVSVSPCCFNLAEEGETESNLEVTNNNSFPIYFKLVTTNVVAMHFKPRSGRIKPYGKVLIKGYHAKSATPIGLQQTIGVMTSRIPLEDWPEEDYCQPMNYKETLEMQIKDRREDSIHSKSSPNNEGFDYKQYRQQIYRYSDQHHSSSPRKDTSIYKKASMDEMKDSNALNGCRKKERIQRSFYEIRPSSNAAKNSDRVQLEVIKKISECSCRLCNGGEYDIDIYPKECNRVAEKHRQFQKNCEQEQNSDNYNTKAQLHPNACRKRNTAYERNLDTEKRSNQNLKTKQNHEYTGHEHNEDQLNFSRNQQKQATSKETEHLSNFNKFQPNSTTRNDKKNKLPKESDEYSKNVNKSTRKKKTSKRNLQSKCYCELCIKLNKASIHDSEHSTVTSFESHQPVVGSTSSSATPKDTSESSDIDSFYPYNSEEHVVYRSLFHKCYKMLHKCHTVLQRVDSNVKLNFMLLCITLSVVVFFIGVYFVTTEIKPLASTNIYTRIIHCFSPVSVTRRRGSYDSVFGGG